MGFPTLRLTDEDKVRELVQKTTMTPPFRNDDIEIGSGGPRRNLGRSARRRRKKLLEIKQQLELVGSPRQDKPTRSEPNSARDSSAILPYDRNWTLPSVLETRKETQWNENDEKILLSQLGYIPGNVVRVAARVSDVACLKPTSDCISASSEFALNAPVVIQLYPLALRDQFERQAKGRINGRRCKGRKRKLGTLHDLQKGTNEQKEEDEQELTVGGALPENCSSNHHRNSEQAIVEPFPTIFWISHPVLRILISQLELSGFGAELEGRLQQDAVAQEKMNRAHKAYAQTRSAMMRPIDREQYMSETASASNWIRAALDEAKRGIAGIRNPRAVKCLHAHVAHHLAPGCCSGSVDNVIGHWVLEKLAEQS
jgi:hypothetical protein